MDGRNGRGCYVDVLSRGDTVKELLEKLEAATEGSKPLSAEVWCAAEGHEFIKFDDYQVHFRDEDVLPGRPLSMSWNAMQAIPYTTSIDGALTLMPEGLSFGVHFIKRDGEPLKYQAQVRRPGMLKPDEPKLFEASTPALALCIAALKARETT